MADVSSGNSKYTYKWNPFQDLVDNNITDETLTVKTETGTYSPIMVPRCGPFFASGVTVKVKSTGKALSLENGDYSFVYPYMTFLKDYQKLVYGGILLHNQPKGTTYLVSYSTLGGNYVFDDTNYAKFVGNLNANERTANWDQLVNLPTEWPADPHDHPAKDTVSYLDMITWMKSYLDAITGSNTSITVSGQLEAHIAQTIDKAHGGGLAELGVKNLKDYPIADATTIKGESSQVYASVWSVKNLIRGYINGEWS